MDSLPSLPPLGPIVFQFPFGFDATLDVGPSTARRDDAPDSKSISGDSSMRKVAFARADANSELGGDAAVPEAVPVSEPVSVPEAVESPESTNVPEVVTKEVVTPPEQVDTATAPAPAEGVVNEVQTESPTVERIETAQIFEPVPTVRRSSTVVVTVPAEAVEEQEAVTAEPRPLSRKSTTITITVAENKVPTPSRKASLSKPKAEFVNTESADSKVEAPVRAETMHVVNLEGGTSVTVTEAAEPPPVPPVQKTTVPPQKIKKIKVVKRARVMGLWRRIIAKVMRKRAEMKVQKATQVDGTTSPQDEIESFPQLNLYSSVNKRAEPEAPGSAPGMRTSDSIRVPVDDFFYNGATQSVVEDSTNAASSRQGPCTDTACGS